MTMLLGYNDSPILADLHRGFRRVGGRQAQLVSHLSPICFNQTVYKAILYRGLGDILLFLFGGFYIYNPRRRINDVMWADYSEKGEGRKPQLIHDHQTFRGFLQLPCELFNNSFETKDGLKDQPTKEKNISQQRSK